LVCGWWLVVALIRRTSNPSQPISSMASLASTLMPVITINIIMVDDYYHHQQQQQPPPHALTHLESLPADLVHGILGLDLDARHRLIPQGLHVQATCDSNQHTARGVGCAGGGEVRVAMMMMMMIMMVVVVVVVMMK
jgi:hypothetical protein